jgi:hypothetical protein
LTVAILPLQHAYKAFPCPPFGNSDHDSILLLPFYRQKLKQEAPMVRTIQRWSDQSESMLQDCFDHADLDMFRVASENNIDTYIDTVNEFIRKFIGDVESQFNGSDTRCTWQRLKTITDY